MSAGLNLAFAKDFTTTTRIGSDPTLSGRYFHGFFPCIDADGVWHGNAGRGGRTSQRCAGGRDEPGRRKPARARFAWCHESSAVCRVHRTRRDPDGRGSSRGARDAGRCRLRRPVGAGASPVTPAARSDVAQSPGGWRVGRSRAKLRARGPVGGVRGAGRFGGADVDGDGQQLRGLATGSRHLAESSQG